MDTRYWGPSAWRLLHTIVHASSHISADTKALSTLFETLPYVLPCKFCRTSLSEYYAADPIPRVSNAFPKWLWRIHNMVNAKLRQQNLSCAAIDPPFSAVKEFYESRLAIGCTRTTFEGWEFLFSVAENHPLSIANRHSTPIPSAPTAVGHLSITEKNRWNLLTPEERLPIYVSFWLALADVLPFSEWKINNWKGVATAAAENRTATVKALWTTRCALENELELLNRTTYSMVCKELKSFKSGCTISTRGKTCRVKKRGAK